MTIEIGLKILEEKKALNNSYLTENIGELCDSITIDSIDGQYCWYHNSGLHTLLHNSAINVKFIQFFKLTTLYSRI
jgi:hypothetical protein